MLKIGIFDYEYKEVDNLKESEKKVDGLCDFAALTISVDKKLLPIHKEVTVWHEILHVVSNQYSLHLNEREVDCLAHAIVGIYKDNKDFLKGLK